MKIKKRGLTLIELLAVIAIIAILFVLLIPQISNSIEKAREAGLMTDFKNYEIASKSYFFEKNNNPLDAETFNTFLDKEMKFTANTSTKKSPFGNHYELSFLNDKNLEIVTYKDKKRYSFLISFLNNEVISSTKGFSNDLKNENYIQSENGFDFIKVGDNSSMIVGYTGSNSDVAIPSTLGGLSVEEVGLHAFSSSSARGRNTGSTVSSVILPNTLKKINGYAFYNNNISSIVFPSSLTLIGEHSFYGNKITNLTIPFSVQIIDIGAFSHNNSLATYKILGNPYIGRSAFPSTAAPIN